MTTQPIPAEIPGDLDDADSMQECVTAFLSAREQMSGGQEAVVSSLRDVVEACTARPSCEIAAIVA